MADDLFMISILTNEPCIELAGMQAFSSLDRVDSRSTKVSTVVQPANAPYEDMISKYCLHLKILAKRVRVSLSTLVKFHSILPFIHTPSHTLYTLIKMAGQMPMMVMSQLLPPLVNMYQS
jgi:hypothetical protein